MSRRRVVVTGMGIVSPVGVGLAAAWDSIRNARSGVAAITRFDCSTFPTRIAAEVKNFDVAKYLSGKEIRRYDTFVHYGLAASMDAVDDAGLADYAGDKERVGVCIGSGIGGLPLIEDTKVMYLAGGWRKITPFFIPGSIINMVAGLVSIHYGYQGPNLGIVSACSTANHSIGEAGRLIEYGDADVMLAGGAESTVSALGIGSFCAARALSTRNDDPETASRPWDVDRDGFVQGEGAGILVLEELEHAKARGARIYCELAGYGMSADAHHITAPPEDGHGGARSMRNAMRNAGLNSEDIHYINAHGTSTPLGRHRGMRRDQAGVRRPCAQARGQLDQVDDRPPAGGGRRRGGGIHGAGIARPGRAADGESLQRRPEVRPRFRAARRARHDDPRGTVQFVRLRRHQRHAGFPKDLIRVAALSPQDAAPATPPRIPPKMPWH